MAYQSFPYSGFGKGLNLRDKPDAVDPAEAIDAMNVGFSERGAIVTRGGYVQRVALTQGEEAMGLGSMVRTGGSSRILSVVEDRLRAYSTTGSSSELGDSGSLTTPAAAFSFARFGGLSSGAVIERVYASNGTDVRFFDGTNFTNPNLSSIVVPKGRYLAVQSTDNRLVSTGFLGASDGPAGATTNPSYVWFSDPGDPATWNALDYVQLTPGDGEKIQGAVGWRELVFVFKESKFFVFYGNSQNAAGDPIFNYRPVEGGVGLASPFGIATTRNGVYFVGPDGLYRTTGSSAEKVSDAVEPLWTGNNSGYYTGGTISDITSCRLAAVDDTIYMAFTSTEGQRVLVHDTDAGWFSLYDLPATWVHGFDGTLWFTTTGLPDDYDFIVEHRRTDPDDNGTAIQAKWRSGWLDFNSPDIKVVRASKFWGNGRTSIGMTTDFEEGDGSLVNVIFTDSGNDPLWNDETWGGTIWAEPRGLAPRQRRRADRGTTFSMLVKGEAAWAVHRATHQVRQVRQPGIEDDTP